MIHTLLLMVYYQESQKDFTSFSIIFNMKRIKTQCKNHDDSILFDIILLVDGRKTILI